MKIDNEKLQKIIKQMSKETSGMCAETSVFIGEINGKPIRLSVMTSNEAEEEHYFEGFKDKFVCIGA